MRLHNAQHLSVNHVPRQIVLLPTSRQISGRRGVISPVVWQASLRVVLAEHLISRCLRAERDDVPWSDLGRASSSGESWRPAATWVVVERCHTYLPSTSPRPPGRRPWRWPWRGLVAEERQTVRQQTTRLCLSFFQWWRNPSACRFLQAPATTSRFTLQSQGTSCDRSLNTQ